MSHQNEYFNDECIHSMQDIIYFLCLVRKNKFYFNSTLEKKEQKKCEGQGKMTKTFPW